MPCISSKRISNIVHGDDVRPIVVTSTSRTGTFGIGSASTSDASSTSTVAPIFAPQPTVEQLCWDGKYV